MIAHYIKKSLAKKNTPFDVILCGYKIYFSENNICKIVLKKKVFQKQFKWFKIKFMKVEDTLNHVNKPCENFNKFHFIKKRKKNEIIYGKLKIWQLITFIWKVTSIAKVDLFKILSQKLILMTYEALMLMHLKWKTNVLIFVYIINIPIDLSILISLFLFFSNDII